MTNKTALCINKRTIINITIFILTLLFALIINTSKVNAADKSTIMKKWLYTQLYSCFENEFNNSQLPQKTDNSLVAEDVFRKEGTMYLPSFNFQYNGTYTFVNCYELFNGSGGISGLKNDATNSNATWSTQENAKSFLYNMGYTFDSTEDISFKLNLVMEKCNYKYNTTYNPRDCNLKEAVDKKTESISSSLISIDSKTGTYSIDNKTMGENFTVDVNNNKREIIIKVYEGGSLADADTIIFDDVPREVIIPFGSTPQETIKNIENILPNLNWLIRRTTNDAFSGTKYTIKNYYFNTSDMTTVIQGGNYYFAENQTRFNVSNRVVLHLSGMSVPMLALTPSEKYTLYVYYLDKSIPASISPRITCSPENTANLVQVRLKDSDGEFKTCYANFNNTKPSSINVYTQLNKVGPSSVKVPYITTINMQGVIDWLNETSSSELDDVEPLNAITKSDDIEESTEETADPCYDNSASLGWIVCPIMTKIAEALDGLYDKIIEPFLIVEPTLLTSGDTNGTWQAWSIMVNIANILLVIFLFVVIFSQITGVGITNYGIKKSLPKIFIAAILINLSFIICQLAVDISNILGNSLNEMLVGIGKNVKPSLPEAIDATGINSSEQAGWFKVLLTLGAGGIVGIGIASVASAIFDTGILAGLVIPALLLFVIAIISIIFFFIILGVRKAAVVIFVVLSPLAFVCYMLPNTKKYFDKWLDGFKALLMVYPICGLLLGGSFLVSRVILQAQDINYVMYFTGSMIMIVPYFFIPSLLKGSLRAMGDLGAKLSSLGKSLGTRSSNRLGNTIKNSKGYKERVEQNQENAALRRANRIKKRLGEKDYDSLSKRQQRSLYKAQKTLIADEDIESRAANMATTGYEAAIAGVQSKARDEEISNRLFLMQQNGINGKAYTLDNMDNRMKELAKVQNLSSDEQLELAALARGMVSEKGGAGKLAKIVRDEENEGVSQSFMTSLGDTYANDSTVRSKMREKDAGASIYTEHFMKGGDMAEGKIFSDFKDTNDYQVAIGGRIKSHEVGLGQSGAAFKEYLTGIDNKTNKKKDLYQDIMNNQDLLQQLDVTDREEVVSRANSAGVYGPKPMDVNVIDNNPTTTTSPARPSSPNTSGNYHVPQGNNSQQFTTGDLDVGRAAREANWNDQSRATDNQNDRTIKNQ